jgi:hypothetical protein
MESYLIFHAVCSVLCIGYLGYDMERNQDKMTEEKMDTLASAFWYSIFLGPLFLPLFIGAFIGARNK